MSTSHYEDELMSEFSYVQSDIIPKQRITTSQYSDDENLPPPNLSTRQLRDSDNTIGRHSYMSSFSEYSDNLNSREDVAQPVSVKVVNEPIVPTINRSLSQKQQQEVRDQERQQQHDKALKKLETSKTFQQLTPDYQYNTNIEHSIPPRSSRRPKSEIIDTSNLTSEINQYKSNPANLNSPPLPDLDTSIKHRKRISLAISDDLDKLMERANSIQLRTFTFNNLPKSDTSSVDLRVLRPDLTNVSSRYQSHEQVVEPLTLKKLPPRPSVENLSRARQVSGGLPIESPLGRSPASLFKPQSSPQQYHQSSFQTKNWDPTLQTNDVETSPAPQPRGPSVNQVNDSDESFNPPNAMPETSPTPIAAPVLAEVPDNNSSKSLLSNRSSNRSSKMASKRSSRISQTLPQPPIGDDNESNYSDTPLIRPPSGESRPTSSGYMPVPYEYQLPNQDKAFEPDSNQPLASGEARQIGDYSPKGETEEFMKPKQVFDDEQGSSVNEANDGGYPGYPSHYPEEGSFHQIRPAQFDDRDLPLVPDQGPVSSSDHQPQPPILSDPHTQPPQNPSHPSQPTGPDGGSNVGGPKTPEDMPQPFMKGIGLITPGDKPDDDYYDIEEPELISKPARAKSVKDSTKHPHRSKLKSKRKSDKRTKSQQLKPFSYHTLVNLLDSINGTVIGEEFNQLNLPVKEKQLIEKIVDQLSRLTSDMVLDDQRYEAGIDRLERALRVLEGFM